MSQYVSSDYYLNTYGGKTITDINTLNNELLKASEKIDDLTHNRIVKIGFDNLTEFQQEKIQRAVCLHADYIFNYGADYGEITSYSVLDINVSINKKSSIEANFGTTREVYNLIKQTGLATGIL